MQATEVSWSAYLASPGSARNAFLAMNMTLGLQVQLASGYSKAAAKYKDKEERTLLEVINGSTDGGITVAPCTKNVPLKDKNYLLASQPANCVTIAINNSGN